MSSKYYLAILPILLAIIIGCETNTNQHKKKQETYVDFKGWSEGRVCDKVLWKCLPESKDTIRWQKPLKNGLDSFELTTKVLQKQRAIVQRWRDEEDGKVKEQSMKLSQLSEGFYDRVEAKKFLSEMEQRLEKEFPGFWRDTPKKVRFRWIQRAMHKAKKLGITSKRPGGIIELCARIGLDFDKNPKWDYITNFIKNDPRNHVSYAVDYIDYTVFNKTYDRTGTKITDWSMGRAIGKLPYPKKPYPRLND